MSLKFHKNTTLTLTTKFNPIYTAKRKSNKTKKQHVKFSFKHDTAVPLRPVFVVSDTSSMLLPFTFAIASN